MNYNGKKTSSALNLQQLQKKKQLNSKSQSDNILLLSIQNMIGGGSPAGGRHGSTKETPSWTTNGLIVSFDHKGDSVLIRDGHGHIRLSIVTM